MECWAWIPGFEGLYQVSTRGRVRSVDRWVTDKTGRKQFIKGKILKPRRTRHGYFLVTLCRDGKKLQVLVHRLVAETFIPNPENKPQVHHRNEQKDMNFVENLSWASAKENVNFGTGIKRRAASQSMPVEAIDPNTGEVLKEFPSMMEAERNGFSASKISKCCCGKRRHHRGLIWRYKQE